MGRRQWLLWSALCAALAGTFWVTDGDEPAVSGQRKVRKAAPESGRKSAVAAASRKDGLPTMQELAQVLNTQRPGFSVDGPDAFALHDWQPPPPPVAPEPLPSPTVPPFPFRYIGSAKEGSKVVAFVENDTESRVLHEGDTLGEYRVTKITAGSATLIYLPLNETQFLRF